MNKTAILEFFQNHPVGRLLIAAFLGMILYFIMRGHNESNQAAQAKATTLATNIAQFAEYTSVRGTPMVPKVKIPEKPKVVAPPPHVVVETPAPTPPQPRPVVVQQPQEKPRPNPPLTLFRTSNPEPDAQLSSVYAPFGRVIPCTLVFTIDSMTIETPIIGYTTEDLWHDGQLVLPAGCEVHGIASVDRIRERITSEGKWVIVWRDNSDDNGLELPVEGKALDMARQREDGYWEIQDGAAGIRGDILKSDNLQEVKLFAATFISGIARGFQDRQTFQGPMGQSSVYAGNVQNATTEGASAVLDKYAEQIQKQIEKDGFFVRVPAGKQFYLYVEQPIDKGEARRGATLLSRQEALQSQKKITFATEQKTK